MFQSRIHQFRHRGSADRPEPPHWFEEAVVRMTHGVTAVASGTRCQRSLLVSRWKRADAERRQECSSEPAAQRRCFDERRVFQQRAAPPYDEHSPLSWTSLRRRQRSKCGVLRHSPPSATTFLPCAEPAVDAGRERPRWPAFPPRSHLSPHQPMPKPPQARRDGAPVPKRPPAPGAVSSR